MSDISKINVGGTEYNIKDATARTETQPISRGGTGATTASGALSNLGALPLAGGTMTGDLTVPNITATGEIGVQGKIYVNQIADRHGWRRYIETDTNANVLIGSQCGGDIYCSNTGMFVLGFGKAIGCHSTYCGMEFQGGGAAPLAVFEPNYDNKMYLGMSNRRFINVYSVNGVSSSSDRRLKKGINDDFSALKRVFTKFRPVTFEYADQADGLTRIGFIAQEVEQVMAEEGLNADDYAFLKKDTIDEDSEMAKFIGDTTVYSLNYSEFIALNTYMIQQQQAEIDDLELRLSALEARLSNGDSN